jgi:hypothetical protein
MKYSVKCRFHGKEENMIFNVGDSYETEDLERAVYLAGLGLIEFETNIIEYDTKVIKTRGRKKNEST